MPKKLYETLGIQTDASEKDVKQAYRKLALIHHPDKSSKPESAEKFKEITTAYEILGDANKRMKYDKGLIDETGAEQRESILHQSKGASSGKEKSANKQTDKNKSEPQPQTQKPESQDSEKKDKDSDDDIAQRYMEMMKEYTKTGQNMRNTALNLVGKGLKKLFSKNPNENKLVVKETANKDETTAKKESSAESTSANLSKLSANSATKPSIKLDTAKAEDYDKTTEQMKDSSKSTSTETVEKQDSTKFEID